ncbi:hypothetical protein [Ruegeria arenilitoris]|uniref:hypothetical protein n=1 Tax=Ruegeria arenilitoris TaxID=1173585 RepID=UPI00147CA618|nr:hypothetical protein [Ruegeria arenilitoris]
MFRSAQTAEALRHSSPKIRFIFEDAGFALEPTESDLPHGFYRPEENVERELVLRALFANIRAIGVKGEHRGEFDFWQFLENVKTARPQPETRRQAQVRTSEPQQPPKPKAKRRSIQGRIGFALGLAVVVIAVLRYLAAAGATP